MKVENHYIIISRTNASLPVKSAAHSRLEVDMECHKAVGLAPFTPSDGSTENMHELDVYDSGMGPCPNQKSFFSHFIQLYHQSAFM